MTIKTTPYVHDIGREKRLLVGHLDGELAFVDWSEADSGTWAEYQAAGNKIRDLQRQITDLQMRQHDLVDEARKNLEPKIPGIR